MSNGKPDVLKKILSLPWYVLLLGIYPVLSLYASNVSELQPHVGWQPLLLSAAAALVLLLILRLILKDWHRAGVFTALGIALFFLYGHVYTTLKTVPFLVPVTRHRFLLPVWMLLALALACLLIKRKAQPGRGSFTLNVMALIALVFPLANLAGASAQSRAAQADFTPVDLPALSYPAGETPPDIYYIILDAYGSSQTLKTLMGFDNSAFLDQLRAQGFFIAKCSLSNFATTELSLTSSLTLDYLPAG